MIEPGYIFVSHSHRDNAFTQRLCDDLRAAGIAVWVDLADTHGGDFVEHINSALTAAQAVLVVVTPHALRSIAVRTEAHAGIHLLWQRRISALLPVIAETVEEWMIPPLWSIFHRYDAVNDYGQALAELTSAITSQRLGDFSQAPDISSLVQVAAPPAPPALPPAPTQPVGSGQIIIEANVVEGDARVIGYVAPQPLEHQDVRIRIDTLRDRASAIGFFHQPMAKGLAGVDTSLFLFDVTGVLTNLESDQPAIDVLGQIAELLQAGNTVALNSSRGLVWLAKTIVAPLIDIIWDVRALDRLCIVSENGAVLSTIQRSGEMASVIEPGIPPIPATLRASVARLVASAYADTMFPGEQKEYVLSPQMLLGADRRAFMAAQTRLIGELQRVLAHEGLAQRFVVHPTGLATDIEDRSLGKALGARRILAWLEERGESPQRFVAFGDSPSDLPMATELAARDVWVEFVYIGDPARLDAHAATFPITFAPSRYDRGVFAYLRQREHR